MAAKHASNLADWNLAAESFAGLGFSTEWHVGYPAILARLGELRGKRVLDFGCGDGKFSVALAARGARVTGVDSSRSMIRLAKRRHNPGVDFLLVEPRDLHNFTVGEFDAAVSCWVVCTISSSAELKLVARAIARALRPGGKWLIIENNPAAFGNHFSSFEADARIGFDLSVKGKVDVSLYGPGQQPLRIVDQYWPSETLGKLLTQGTGLELTKVGTSAPEFESGSGDGSPPGRYRPFRILEFRRGVHQIKNPTHTG